MVCEKVKYRLSYTASYLFKIICFASITVVHIPGSTRRLRNVAEMSLSHAIVKRYTCSENVCESNVCYPSKNPHCHGRYQRHEF